MIDQRATQKWGPTEAELRAVITDYCSDAGPHDDPEQSYGCEEGGCPICRVAFTKELALVGPLIAARGLRQACNAIRSANGPAHTYSSENADHYRGYDVGIMRATEFLLARAASLEASVNV